MFGLAMNAGSYGATDRGGIAISAWWLVILGIALAFLPLRRPTRQSLVVAALLAAFAVWTGLSMVWAESDERAFAELNRVTLYLGIFTLVLLASDRVHLRRWIYGLAVGIAAIGLVALTSRLFPGVFPAGDIPRFLPSAVTRLSYPLGYWNALAIFAGLGFPLLVSAALTARSRLGRGLALAPLPALAAVIYLTSSRGGVGAMIVGLVALVAFARERLAALGAIVFAAAGSAGAVAVLLGRLELVNGPLDSPAAASQGRSAAVLIALICVAVGVAFGILGGVVRRPVTVGPRLRMAAAAAAAVVAVALVAGVVAVDPAQSFETFKQPPAGSTLAQRDFVRAHLLSGSGSGRWQFWGAAIDQLEAAPLIGQGAGSYEAFWARNAPFAFFVRDAHSLYLETLGELGAVGLLLLAAALGFSLVTAVRRLPRQPGDDRLALAALAAVLVGWVFATAIDWMWEMTAVTAVTMACLALVTGPATALGPAAGRSA
ncbi:MAG: O-antigen ligase family protein, partial [Actinomycetota bacterium]|nr:O-antigen ligase family protein [Actinomycetota bacterium]